MFDYRLAMMCGTDLPVPECQIVVHQPKIKEIALLGEQDFFIGAQCLTLNKSMFVTEDKDVLDNINNFQIFMTVMNEKEARDKKKATMDVLRLLIPTHNPLITPVSLVLSSTNGNITIDGDNFETLQDVLRLVFCTKNGPMDQQAFNPANDTARKIAEKLMRGRQRVVAQKNGGANHSVFSQYLSILTIGLNSMDLESLTNLTMFQLYDLIERYGLYVNWDIDLRSRLAGGKPDKQPDDWMKNIH